MMRFIAAFVVGLMATAAIADTRELSQQELREAVTAERAIATRSLIKGVENFTGGEVLDIRAFLSDGSVIYRILYRKDDGLIETIMVDGSSGRAVNPNSDSGQSVMAFAGANPGNGDGNAFGLSGRTVDNNGRGNSNGRSNGGGGNGGGGNGNGRNN